AGTQLRGVEGGHALRDGHEVGGAGPGAGVIVLRGVEGALVLPERPLVLAVGALAGQAGGGGALGAPGEVDVVRLHLARVDVVALDAREHALLERLAVLAQEVLEQDQLHGRVLSPQGGLAGVAAGGSADGGGRSEELAVSEEAGGEEGEDGESGEGEAALRSAERV